MIDDNSIPEYVKSLIDDEAIFPDDEDPNFGSDFQTIQNYLNNTSEQALFYQALKDEPLAGFLRFMNGLKEQGHINSNATTFYESALKLHGFLHNNSVKSPDNQGSIAIYDSYFKRFIEQDADRQELYQRIQDYLKDNLNHYVQNWNIESEHNLSIKDKEHLINYIKAEGQPTYNAVPDWLNNLRSPFRPTDYDIIIPEKQLQKIIQNRDQLTEQAIKQAIDEVAQYNVSIFHQSIIQQHIPPQQGEDIPLIFQQHILDAAIDTNCTKLINPLLATGAYDSTDLFNLPEVMQALDDYNSIAHCLIAAGYAGGINCLTNDEIDATTDNQETALHLAVSIDDQRAIEYLIERRPQLINKPDVNGKTALDIARDNSNNEAINKFNPNPSPTDSARCSSNPHATFNSSNSARANGISDHQDQEQVSSDIGCNIQ